MLESFLRTIKEKNFFSKEDKIILAISGGKDSISLFHLLLEFFGDKKENLILYHLNHNLRGQDSNRDQEFIKNLAKKNDIKCHIESVDIKEIAQKRKISIEEAGRDIRRKSLLELAERYKAYICLAHNKDDQAETVLMRIIRGTGVEGLAGIKSKDGRIIRPLLDFNRKQIEAYVEDNKLEYVQDHTNFQNIYTRNKIRNILIPSIEKEFNVNFKQALVSLSENARSSNKISSLYIENLIDKYLVKKELGITYLDPSIFDNHDHLAIGEIIRFLIKQYKGSIYGFTKKHMEEFIKVIDGKVNSCKCINGICISKTNDYILINKEQVNELDYELVAIDGQYRINNYMINIFSKNKDKNIIIRKRIDGDRVSLNGKHRKLKDLFNDKKIPALLRDYIPIIEIDRKIVAIGDLYMNDEILKKNNIDLIIKKLESN